MPTNYPTSIDSFVNPTPTDPPDNPDHAGQHANINDAMEAVQATLGVNPQGGAASVSARILALEGAASGVTMTPITQIGSATASTATNVVGEAAVSIGAAGAVVSAVIEVSFAESGFGLVQGLVRLMNLAEDTVIDAGTTFRMAGDTTGPTVWSVPVAIKFVDTGDYKVQVLVEGSDAADGGTITNVRGFVIT